MSSIENNIPPPTSWNIGSFHPNNRMFTAPGTVIERFASNVSKKFKYRNRLCFQGNFE